MEEPLLKASIDLLPAPEESKGLTVAQGFLGRHKGADVQVPVNKGIMLPIANNLNVTENMATFLLFQNLRCFTLVALWCSSLTTFFQLFLED